MLEAHQKIIDAIIRKAEKVCPDSLALIGLYGSAATGDMHEKSDLDLLILIQDDRGRQLADGFILTDTGIGYDMYCTTWEMLEADAECGHAHLAKLLDSRLLFVKDPEAVQRLETLRKKAADLLASEERFTKARAALDNAKKIYADCYLTESLSQIRTGAGGVIWYLLDAVMLRHGRYFRKGSKRTFEELDALQLSFDMQELVLNVIRADTGDEIRNALTDLLKAVQACIPDRSEKEAPSRDNLAGTYEEIFSNWRNKMKEAADRKDLYSSFMNMVSFQSMLCDITESVAVEEQEIMDGFDPYCLEKNPEAFDAALDRYLQEYRKLGMQPKRYADADAFAAAYSEAE